MQCPVTGAVASALFRPPLGPSAVRAAWWCLWRRWFSGHRRARPSARSPHARLKARSGRSRSLPVPSGPFGARHTGVWCVDRWFRASASNRAGSPVMSHVIPVHIFQTLKCGRWNCNVCDLSRKVTVLNYVRLLLGWLPSSLSGLSTAPATATWPAGALSIGTVKIRPLCNGLELGSGGLQHEELAAGVSAVVSQIPRLFL